MTYFFKISITFCVLHLFLGSMSQNIEFKANLFPGKEDSFERAKDYLDQGDVAFLNATAFCRYNLDEKYCKQSEKYFKEAIAPYLKAQAFNPNNSLLNFRLGISMFIAGNAFQSLPYFVRSYQLNPRVDSLITWYLARSYHLNAQWDSASRYYNVLKTKVKQRPGSFKISLQDIERAEQNTTNGKNLQDNTTHVTIRNLGKQVNTTNFEYNPIVFENGRIISYTSREEQTLDPDFYEDLSDDSITQMEKTLVTLKTTDVTWSTGSPFIFNQKKSTFNQGSILDISQNGQSMLVYKNGDIYESTFTNNTWSDPELITGEINTEYLETSAAYSPDGLTIFFTSNKPGGLGMKDIYSCTLDSSHSCVDVKNLGNTVNTPDDEDGLFVAENGTSLFFSSKGHNSMGGYDIFLSTLDDSARWTPPVNMKQPFNSPCDDIFMVFSNKHSGFFSSSRNGGFGNMDIYEFLLDKPFSPGNTPLKPADSVTPEAIAIPEKRSCYAIKTLDANMRTHLDCHITARDTRNSDVIEIHHTGSSPALLHLIPSLDYTIIVRAEGYSSKTIKSLASFVTDSTSITVFLPPLQNLTFAINPSKPNDSIATTSYLYGEIEEFNTKKNIVAHIRILDEQQKNIIAECDADANGKYRVSIKSGRKYTVETISNGYSFQIQQFNVPEGSYKIGLKCSGTKNESTMVSHMIPDSLKSSIVLYPLCLVEATITTSGFSPRYCDAHLFSTDTADTFHEKMSGTFPGTFTAMIPTNKKYSLKVNADGYEFAFDNKLLDIPSHARIVQLSTTLFLPPPPHQELSLKTITFETNKATVKDSIINTICNKLSTITSPKTTITIIGHTDDVGTATYNQALSEKRAKFVAQKIKPCIRSSRSSITTRGVGEYSPLVENTSDQNRAENRCVEIKVTTDIEYR